MTNTISIYNRKYYIVFLTILFNFIYTNINAASNSRSDTLDIKKISIHLDITDFSNRTIFGYAQLDLQAKLSDVNVSYFDLKALIVDSVSWNGEIVTFSQIGETIKVTHPNLIENENAICKIYYHGQPVGDASGWGGFYFQSPYAYNLGVGFASDPHPYGRVWFPCFDNFVERSSYEFFIRTALTHKAICNGLLQSATPIGTDKTEWHWKLDEEIPSYLASVAVAPYQILNDIYHGNTRDIPIQIAALATDTNDVKASFIHLKPTLKAFEDHFGDYIWSRVGYVMVPFSSGAMEHATNIAYPLATADGTLNYEDLYAHELSHHWFGDRVTCRTQEDMWLNEGWASYSEKIFYETLYGKAKYKKEVRSNHLNVLMNAHLDDGSYLPVSGINHEYTYGTHVYKKGSDVAHTLRGYMGDSLFFNCIKNYLVQFQNKDASSEDFKNSLMSCSSLDLDDFFKDWVYAEGFPHFQISDYNIQEKKSGTFQLNIAIHQRSHHAPHLYKNVPLEITMYDSLWNKNIQQVIVSDTCSEFTLIVPFLPVYIALDENEKISDAICDETKIIKSTGLQNFAEEKLTLTIDTLVDSALVRIQHHFVNAEKTSNLSSKTHLATHYWSIEGILPEDFSASSIFNYNGTASNGYLDKDFITTSEDSIYLYYREKEGDDWYLYPFQTRNTIGSTTNKVGNIKAENIKLGYYTFGIQNSGIPVVTDISEKVCIANVSSDYISDDSGIALLPNPASHICSIVVSNNDIDTIDIFDTNGKWIQSIDCSTQRMITLSLKNYNAGIYYVQGSKKGEKISTRKLIVSH